jgi:hypothetical protein
VELRILLFVKAAVFWGWRERGAKGQRVQAGRMQLKGAIGQWGRRWPPAGFQQQRVFAVGRGGPLVSLHRRSSEGSRIGKGWEWERELERECQRPWESKHWLRVPTEKVPVPVPVPVQSSQPARARYFASESFVASARGDFVVGCR